MINYIFEALFPQLEFTQKMNWVLDMYILDKNNRSKTLNALYTIHYKSYNNNI